MKRIFKIVYEILEKQGNDKKTLKKVKKLKKYLTSM